ncbi:hypothetical protein AMIS_41050 [Actinoplanes missouriensis 431]|uniref:DUF4253 domain-containing protein n=1 Tax=Actinoplanes missouriensis (strain ATCC 14538 / DSM 43046 / CBS 188.64 / JCM 3121 / NBRC 102363 / NCIMB 12654 / NRRL B-3342 / UNCC 431) TaxID=512565 RepID=I0H8I8_ACTM4|nr:DUF4253 domain-containing protein [Actinoplanes missouriensis]BAL89325.1 hypothetical protein AMIS_41050 [Actinoplanes missouriensis 431]
MKDPHEFMAAFRGTALDGHMVEEGPAGIFVVEGLDSTALLPLWHAARAAVPVTGRWPVITGLEDTVDLDREPAPEECAAFAAAAQTLDPWAVFSERPDFEAWQVSSYLDACLGPDAGRRDDPRLGGITRRGLDRWVYDQMLADPVLAGRGIARGAMLTSTRGWHAETDAQLVLLPTPAQWLTPLWLSYYGAGRDRESLGAAILEWEQRWGAQLVASWGTMLQFLASRPPSDSEDAWGLAGQLMAVGGSLQHEQWELALALPRGEAWFLHCRP